MAPKNDANEGGNPTGFDHKFFYTLSKHLPRSVEVDWAAFTAEMEYRDVSTAKMRFGQVRKKFGVGHPTGTPSQSPSKITKAPRSKKVKGGAKGRPKKIASSDDDDFDVKGVKKDSDDEVKNALKSESETDSSHGKMKRHGVSATV
ncbi:uncharacterized protein F4822DRAFT_243613 [Hypoxylon trugodes]|uniref:uncharacterized protein n=1 Tax=Hypoxylon trugodes TaxID=326681 RepID=UPI0021979682|nr:uncharacterized protein F4822DRAFT_243613 [Hypoxylon trugodes]KAI1388363.1 hypothetical protein F4822DRAFT_243613 [Hypoxylon trugodes]